MAAPDRLTPCRLPAGLGATVTEDGVAFAVFSRHGERVELCLFDEDGVEETARLKLPSRSGDIHHGWLRGAGAGLRYGFRVHGPWQPDQGHRFDPEKLLVDPYASLIDRPFRWDPILARLGADSAGLVPRSVVAGALQALPVRPESEAPELIYELSVKSFSMRHPAVPEPLRGTLAALREPAILAHLRRLGVSHVELMPIAAWMDERHLPPLGLSNAWGYNPVNFFALDPRLAPQGTAELRALCETYANAGIGVILDIVLNHTAESDAHGATLCLRGFDNAVYYRHSDADPGLLVNDTGCGHTLALDRAPVMRMAMDSLRHWRGCGVAGFRFDLGTVMGRTAQGFTPDAPLLGALLQDPQLSRALLIAEPWDIGPGGYQLGAFPAPFCEWNGRYRDDVRRFWRGDDGLAGALATRLAGSADLFAARHRGPRASINFIAAHDGFTLADLVSYEHKHNHANGEHNRDGDNLNHSWNNGQEGSSDDPEILARRRRDLRALLATLFLSRGVPMLTAGDEFGRTQHGNNNAYAQDKAEFWLDWEEVDEALLADVAALSSLRAATPLLRGDSFFDGTIDPASALADVTWLGPDGRELQPADWERCDVFAMLVAAGGDAVLAAFNRGAATVRLTLPALRSGRSWRRQIDAAAGEEELLWPRSVAIFLAG